MIKPTAAQAHAWMSQWRSAEPALARIRAAEIAGIDLWRVADELAEAFWVSVRAAPAPEASGLVERQRIFAEALRR